MTLEKIEKCHHGSHLSYYELTYRLPNGRIKTYETASRRGTNRNPDPLTVNNLNKARENPIGVSLIVTDPTNTRLLVTREFRPAINDWVYEFPGGLIDNQEDPCVTAARELYEETGLTLTQIVKILPASYTSAPLTDETVYIMHVKAAGEPHDMNDPMEPIHACWMDRYSIRKLLENPLAALTSRFQMFAYFWAYGNL